MSEKNKPDPFALESGVPPIPKIKGDLRPVPQAADRISKRVIGVAIGVVAVMMVLFLIALDQMDNKPSVKEKPQKTDAQLAQASNSKLTTNENPLNDGLTNKSPGKSEPLPPSLPKPTDNANPSNGLGDLLDGRLGSGAKPPKTAPRMSEVPRMDEPPPVGRHGQIPSESATGRNMVPALTPEQQAAEKARLGRATRMEQARSDGLSSKAFSTGADSNGAALIQKQQNPSGGGGLLGQLNNASTTAAPKADGEQESKLDFLKSMGKEPNGYHPFVPRVALAPGSEIKTGSFIPMTLETSINSGLPGQVIARVTEDVYDSISGCRMLIPAMTKAVGRYDSKIALGQGRMLLAWNSLIFPNGDELNLAGMQAYDTGGQSGLESDVDNHYWRMFGLTFGLSMITTGVTLSVPQPNPTTTGAAAPQTPSQIIAGSLAQQYGALGAQIIGKYMAIQPTLRNFAGERFVVMVPRTIVFQKIWRDRCGSK